MSRHLVGGLVALLVLPAALTAQSPAMLRGRVVDSATGAPIEEARIQLGAQVTRTGHDGRFEFGSIAAGLSMLMISAIGFRAARLPLDVLPGLDLEQTVRLGSLTPTLPDLQVQARTAAPLLEHDALVRRGADLATAIDGWQGVVMRRSGGNGPASPQVRGSAPEEVIVLVDGFSINDPLTGRADLSRIATRDVASVQVRAGAQPAGGAGVAIGGVIDIRSRLAGGAQAAGWLGSYGSGGGTITGDAAGIQFFARGEWLPTDYPFDVPPNRGGGEANRVNAGGTILNLSLRRAGTVNVQSRFGMSDRGLPGSVGNETPEATAQDRSAFLGVTIDGTSTWSGSVQYLMTETRDPDPPSGVAYHVRSEGASGTLDWMLRRDLSLAGWRGQWEIGAAARHDQFGGDIVQDDSRFTQGSVRASATLSPHGRSPWTLTPSARLDLWTGADHLLGSARLDAGWQRATTTVHASLGSAVSAPPLADLFFREGVGVALNPGLRPERVRWEVEMGITQDWSLFGSPASASLRGYYGLVDDMILWAPGVAFIWSPRNYDVIRRGVDASLRVQPMRTVTLDVQGAWTPITYDVPGGAQVQYRPRGTWGANAGWRGGPWGTDLRWRWVGERFPNPGGINPRPAFGLMDIGAERSIGAATLRAVVRDLFDTRAEFLAGYPTPGRTAIVSISLEWQ